MAFILETARLALRAWTVDDAEALFEICRDADVMKYIGTGSPYQNLDDVRSVLEKIAAHHAAHGYGRMAVIEKSSRKIIGSCGFAHIESQGEIELGYLLSRDAWGKGYATEAARACLRYAFETLKFPQLIALTAPPNTASQHVLEKIGFTSQGLQQVNGDDDIVYLAVNPEQR